jgi:DNA-binding PadR family transcriptional regulator
MTWPTALVLHALAAGHHHGFGVMDATGLASGTVYPILRRLDRDGLARSRWEPAEIAQREQRPPRRYYEITAAGETVLAEALARYRTLAAVVPAPARGLKPSRS